MQHNPIVTVIIPTYNRADLITPAIQSVLGQTFKDTEIIVVDDGSTDNTRKLIEPYIDKIRYILTENKGSAHARNTGMKASSGKYIAFLDSDDIYLPHKLELQVSFMEAHPEVGMVSTEASAASENGFFEEYHLQSYHEIYKRKGWKYDDIYSVSGQHKCSAIDKAVNYYMGDIFKYVLIGPLVISTTILLRREILEKVGYQNESYRLAQEYEHVVRMCKYHTMAFLNIPTYIYRYHNDQTSMVNNPKTTEKIFAEIKTEKVFLQAVLDWGYSDEEYYSKNQEWINSLLGDKYMCLADKWMEYGNAIEARCCLRGARHFAPRSPEIPLDMFLSFLPASLRRVVRRVSRRFRRRR